MAPSLDNAVQAPYAACNQMFRGDLSVVEAIWSERDHISFRQEQGQWRAVHHHTGGFS
jgi:hypothetical protein